MKHAKMRTFRGGEKVLLLLSSHSSKLLLSWKGPFEVVEKVNEVNYRIQLTNKIRLFHANMLKKYEKREGEISSDIVTPVVEFVEKDAITVCGGITVINEQILLNEDLTHLELPILEHTQQETYLDVEYSETLTVDQLRQLKNLGDVEREVEEPELTRLEMEEPKFVRTEMEEPELARRWKNHSLLAWLSILEKQ